MKEKHCVTIMIGCHKGGVSKTQTAVELAIYLAMKGMKVLVIDTDPQANCSTILSNGTEGTGRTMSEILVERNGIKETDVMTRAFSNGVTVDFVMSDISLSRIEARVIGESPKEYIMSDAVASIKDDYDYVVIDTPPSSELIALSSMICTDYLLVVTCADKPSVAGARSIIEVAERVRSNPRLNPNLQLCGLLVTRYRFTISTRTYLALLRKEYQNSILIEPPIGECIKVQEAVGKNMPVLIYDVNSKAAKDYIQAFDSVIKKIKHTR